LQLFVDGSLRARAGLAAEQHEIGQLRGSERAVLERSEPRFGNPDDLVFQEGRKLDALVRLHRSHQRELHTAADQSLQDLVAGGDLDLDGDAGVFTPKAAERVRQQVDTGSRRGP